MVERTSQPAPSPGRLTDYDAGAAGVEGALAGAPSPASPAAAAPGTRWWDREIATGTAAGLAIGAVVVAFFWGHASQPAAPIAPAPVAAPLARLASFGDQIVSEDVRTLAQWIAATNDAGGAPFVVIDKRQARLHVFGADAHLEASTPILLGGARGDDTVPGIGDRALADVLPHERTTPAGRFVGERGHNARGEDVVWVDYDAGVSMHRVLTTHAKERRLERLATPTAEDNRISYGCINVPVAFYEARLSPLFATRDAPIYVLPEVRSMADVFGWRDATQHSPAPLTHVAARHDARP